VSKVCRRDEGDEQVSVRRPRDARSPTGGGPGERVQASPRRRRLVATAGDAEALLRKALAHKPDVVIADVQMPPGREDDGLRAAIELRRQRPGLGVLVLSQHYKEQYALDLIGERPEGVGYLLKERVGDVATFLESVGRVAAGGSALDPEVVARMLGRRRSAGPLDQLSPREREVLAAMAEGKSNRGIGEALVVSDAAVEKHVRNHTSSTSMRPASATPACSSRCDSSAARRSKASSPVVRSIPRTSWPC
jgi:DNA-binding NarL/FixJ family response regulator